MTDSENRENPFVGLRPFFEEDSFYFFGRNEQVTELLELLHETHIVPVLGSSGSGKSSLVRAGLMPTLRAGFMVAQRDGWRMAKCLPGDAPIENFAEGLLKAIGNKPTPAETSALAARIREDVDDAVVELLRPYVTEHDSVLILVDQFEELFAFRNAAGAESDDDPGGKPDAARTAERLARRRDSSLLVSLLLSLAERKDMPVYVVTTMRTDFLGDCDIFTGLPEAINRSGYLVPRLTRAQLRAAIENPAKLMGVRAAPRLVDRILNDVGDRMDRLPLMQHALHRTYEAWRAAGMMGPMDLRDLERIGGLDGALNVQAEATIADVDPLLAERVFKRLTDVDKNQRRVRHPTRLSDLRAVVGGANAAALQVLLDRCVVEGTNFMFASADGQPADPRYNITHESLIRQWNRLRGWVDEEQAQRDWYLGVAARAALYASDTDSGLMPRRDLRVATEVIKQRAPNAAWAIRYPEAPTSFDEAMKFVSDSAAHLKAVRRYTIIGAAVLLIAGIGATLSVLNNGRIASEALKRVDDVARYSAIEKLLVDDPTYAASLAAELTDTSGWNAEHFGLLQRALNADYATAEFRHVDNFGLDGTGKEIAVGYPGGRVEVGDIDGRGAPHAVFQADTSDIVVQIAFTSARGVVVGYRSGEVRLWKLPDVASAAEIKTPVRSWKVPGGLGRLVRLRDSTTILALNDSSHLFLWTLHDTSPRALVKNLRIGEIYPNPENLNRVVIATEPDATYRTKEDDLRVLDAATGIVGEPLPGIDRAVTFVSFREASDEMLVGQSRAPVLYFNGDRIVGTLSDQTYYTSAAFNSTYDLVVASSAYGVIDQYTVGDLEKAKRKHVKPMLGFQAHEEYTQVEYSHDGNWILSWSADGAMRWTLATDSTATTRIAGHRASIFTAVMTPADSRIVSWDADGTLRVWRTPSFTDAVPFTAAGPWNAELSADGSRAVLGYSGGKYVVRSFDDSAKSETLDSLVSMSASVPTISRSGRRVFFETGPPTVSHIWSSGTAVSVKLAPRRQAVQLPVFSDDDSLLVLTNAGGSVSFINASTGVPIRTDYMRSHSGDATSVAITPNASAVAIAFHDTIVVLRGDSARPVQHELYDASVVDLKFSKDGRKLLAVDDYGFAEVINVRSDVSTGSDSSIYGITSDGRYVTASAISSAGVFVAIATDDRAISIYDTRDTVAGKPRAVVKGLAGYTVHLTFGADDRSLVGTGDDGNVRIWSLDGAGALANDGTQLVLQHTPKVPHQRATPFARSALSPDGKQLTSVLTIDGAAPRIGKWDLDFARIRQRLTTATSACLDSVARKQLLPNETDNERRDRIEACEKRAGRIR